ncbi:TPA: hypothetical protein N0F65_004316 [Lagenidium giganteum]|uniref:FAD-binding domain-containing protein n=1 Tax=Lagenidium giganteum TaxID=4803 RepID=A0AAV2ZB51_9STRA|nr:TPA: hypothetical protein N0F65_004316 [Lagenidium giganteum]
MASTASSTQVPPRIAVVGGGPVGLTFASILQKHQRDLCKQQLSTEAPLFTLQVFEADQDPHSRRQGGSLDLRQESGLQALQAAGLLDAFHALARPEGQDLVMLDKNGTVLYRETAADDQSDAYHPEIDRPQLTQLLRDSLDANTIQWGHKLVRVVPGRTPSEPHVLEFQNGRTAVADLVVGADGAWSRVRPLVSPHQPAYSGVIFMECAIAGFDRRFPASAKLVGNGTLYSFSQGNNLYAQRNADGVMRVCVALRVDADWHRNSRVALADNDAERVQLLLDEHFPDWCPELCELLKTAAVPADNDTDAASSMDLWIRPIYALPIGHSWSHKRGITLLGDAAHLMSPCAGEGVNTGMADALELADHLKGFLAAKVDDATVVDLESSVTAFEIAMFERAGKAAARSAANLEVFFAPRVPTRLDAEKIFNPPASSTAVSA